MSHLRDVRRTAAARTLGERHPWAVLFGGKAVVLVLLLGAAAVLAVLARKAWHGVSGWFSSGPAPTPAVPSTVPAAVPDHPWYSGLGVVPWPVWAVLAVVLVLLAVRYIPRIRWWMKLGTWPTW